MKEEGSHMASGQPPTGQPEAGRERCRDPAHESSTACK